MGPDPPEPGAAAGDPAVKAVQISAFKALLGGASLIAVVLAVAGYSFRWNYYYNFGLHSLVLGTPFTELPRFAIEMLRNPHTWVDLLRFGLLYLLPLNLTWLALRWGQTSAGPTLRTGITVLMRIFLLESALVPEIIVAAVTLVIAFRVGGEAGYRAYQSNVVENDAGQSPLPRVTAITGPADTKDATALIRCDTRPVASRPAASDPVFIGDSRAVLDLAADMACDSNQATWRLLLRDDKYIYLFKTVADPSIRPETLVLPNSDKVVLVLQ